MNGRTAAAHVIDEEMSRLWQTPRLTDAQIRHLADSLKRLTLGKSLDVAARAFDGQTAKWLSKLASAISSLARLSEDESAAADRGRLRLGHLGIGNDLPRLIDWLDLAPVAQKLVLPEAATEGRPFANDDLTGLDYRTVLLGHDLPKLFMKIFPGQTYWKTEGERLGGPGLLFCQLACDALGVRPPKSASELHVLERRIPQTHRPKRKKRQS